MYVDLFKTVPVKFLGSGTYSKVNYRVEGREVVFSVSNPSFKKVSIANIVFNFFQNRKKYHDLITKNIEYSNALEEKNQELIALKNRLESVNAGLNLSNRTLHHDIANKMLSLELTKHLLKKGRVEDALKKLDRFYESVNEIISNSKVKEKDMEWVVEQSNVKIYDVLVEAASDFQGIANKKGIEIECILNIDKNLTLLTNKVSLQNNILSNIYKNRL